MSTLHAWLEFSDPQTGSPRRVEINHGQLSIGRSSGDLRLLDASSSEIHAILTRERESFIIRDLGSEAGTFVNGRFIIEASLANLDEIKIGQTRFTFHAAYLSTAAAASRPPSTPMAPIDFAAPGHTANTPTRRPLFPFMMLVHPLRFWPQALEIGVFQFRRTWFTHLLLASVLFATARLIGGVSAVWTNLGLLLSASTIALVFMAITCSVYFAFDSLSDAANRLTQSLRFTFCVAPFVLGAHGFFLLWASQAHPALTTYFLASMAPTAFFCAFVGIESHFAFSAGPARGLAFAVTASVPWNLFMTGLMIFVV